MKLYMDAQHFFSLLFLGEQSMGEHKFSSNSESNDLRKKRENQFLSKELWEST
jgi:hypothetical protein